MFIVGSGSSSEFEAGSERKWKYRESQRTSFVGIPTLLIQILHSRLDVNAKADADRDARARVSGPTLQYRDDCYYEAKYLQNYTRADAAAVLNIE